MSSRLQRITPCLWFDKQAEEAANFYVSIFGNSHIRAITYYSEEAAAVAKRPEGSVLTVSFCLDGQDMVALNGGPVFKFSEAVSLVVNCNSQAEIDHYWLQLSEGGDERAQQCGWLKDRYGVSWQVVPTMLPRLLADPDLGVARKAMCAMLKMKKIEIDALRRAVA